MKKILTAITLFGALLMLVPAVALITPKTDEPSPEPQTTMAVTSGSEIVTTATEPPKYENSPYLVLDITSDEVCEVSVREYLIGAVAAEMPSSFHEEALKAQAVAAHTYAERRRILMAQTPDANLKGAHFSNDSTKFQAFFTESQMREYFAESYEEKYNKIAGCVDAVLNQIVVWEGEPIIAAFHSMSGGMTESAANVWGGAIEYLVPVDSAADRNAPKYRQEYSFTADEIKQIFADVNFPENTDEYFKIIQKTLSGTNAAMTVGDKEFSGAEVRSLLGLRSSNFDITVRDDSFSFTTYGYGHGVGMSQYGANDMANNGLLYTDILAHYYPNTDIIEIY